MTKIIRYFTVLVFTISTMHASAAEKYNILEDAAVAQARKWQTSGKARPIMSSDGKVIFPFGQSMPKLTCSPTRACDVEMQPSEKVIDVVLGDTVNWTWLPGESIEKVKPIHHVVFQPRDNSLESNAIIYTNRRSYHIKLYAPKQEGIYLNRVGFYYPEELVQSWEEKAGISAAAEAKERSLSVMPAPVPPQKLAFDYRVEGNADFKPLRVFNDGERVYMEMPDSMRTGVNPILMLLDANGKGIVASYRREEDPETNKIHFVVDSVFDKAKLMSDSEEIKIIWKRKEKGFFSWGGNS